MHTHLLVEHDFVLRERRAQARHPLRHLTRCPVQHCARCYKPVAACTKQRWKRPWNAPSHVQMTTQACNSQLPITSNTVKQSNHEVEAEKDSRHRRNILATKIQSMCRGAISRTKHKSALPYIIQYVHCGFYVLYFILRIGEIIG